MQSLWCVLMEAKRLHCTVAAGVSYSTMNLAESVWRRIMTFMETKGTEEILVLQSYPNIPETIIDSIDYNWTYFTVDRHRFWALCIWFISCSIPSMALACFLYVNCSVPSTTHKGGSHMKQLHLNVGILLNTHTHTLASTCPVKLYWWGSQIHLGRNDLFSTQWTKGCKCLLTHKPTTS